MKRMLFCLGLTALCLGCGGTKPRTVPGQMLPDSAEYIANLGVDYLNKGQLDLAEKTLRQALEKKPLLAPALNALALVYVYRRDFAKAIDSLNRLLQVNAKFYDAYNLLGTIYTEQGKYEQARENFLQAANGLEYLTPENAFANLAVLEIKYEKYDAALRYVEKGLLLNRRFAPLYNLKGIVLENLNQLQDAADSFDKALALLTVPDPGYLINSARVTAKLGQKKKALDSLELALGKSRDPAQKVEITRMIRELDER